MSRITQVMTITLLLVISIQLPLFDVQPTPPAIDLQNDNHSGNAWTTISTNTDWSGEVTISDDVQVMHGVTLTVKSGTHVDIAADVTIEVFGNLDVINSTIDSSLEPATIGNAHVGLWEGIVIRVGGTTSITDSSIANSRTALMVDGDADIENLAISSSLLGITVDGGVDADGLTCTDIDFTCLSVAGQGVVSNLTASNISSAVSQTGDLDLTGVEISDAGTGIEMIGGTGDHSGIDFDTVSTAWRIRSLTGVSTDTVTATNAGLLIDAGSSEGFTLTGVSGDASRVLRAEGLQDLTLSGLTLSGDESGNAALDVRNDGNLEISTSTFTGYSMGLEQRGTGSTILSDVTMDTTGGSLQASGTGSLSVSDSAITSEGSFGEFSQVTTTFSDTVFTGGASTFSGLSFVGGTHSMDEVEISREYVGSSDSTSVGISAWWATLSLDQLNLSGWHDGLSCERCSIAGEALRIGDAGGNDGIGLAIIDGSVSMGELDTLHSTTGVSLSGLSTLVISDWDASLHNTALNLDAGTFAAVRDFSTTDVTGTAAIGDGTLHWGSSGTVSSIAVSSSSEYVETEIRTTDLAGNNVSAQVNVGPWGDESDADGLITLPLFASGSDVTASVAGAGAMVTLYGGTVSQTIQLPIIPLGNWTISSGTNVVLGPTPEGTPHSLSGNLLIESGAGLHLDHTTLLLPAGGTITIHATAVLSGDGGSIGGGEMIDAAGTNPLGGSGDGLMLAMNSTIDCGGLRTTTHLSSQADISLGNGCDLTITDGSITGNVSLGSAARLEVRNTFTALVLDAGETIEGASVSIGGETLLSDSQGLATHTSMARMDDSTGTSWGGLVTVTVQRGSLVQHHAWDTNESSSHEFMASTLQGGSLSEWTVLEAEWSPWYLSSALDVPEGVTLAILDNAELIVAEDVAISVSGSMEMGTATIRSPGGGTRWGGLSISGPSATLTTSGGHIVEATKPVSVSEMATISMTGTEVARATDGLIVLNSFSGAIDADLNDLNLHDGGMACIMAQGESIDLSLTDSTLSNCGDHGIWARFAHLSVDQVTLLGGSETGVDLSATSGSLTRIDALAHSGQSYAVRLSEIDDIFTLAGLELAPGNNSAALYADNSRTIDIRDTEIIGAPAVELSMVAGVLENLTLTGQGGGTGILASNPRGSGPLIISNSHVSGYSLGLELTGQLGDEMNPIMQSLANTYDSTTAISSTGRPFYSEGDTIIGNIVTTSQTNIVCTIVDGSFASVSASGNATVIGWRTILFTPMLDGLEVVATVTITAPASMMSLSEEDTSATGLGSEVTLLVPISIFDSSGENTPSSHTVEAEISGGVSLPYSEVHAINATSPEQIQLDLQVNNAPHIQVIDPDEGLVLMEKQVLLLNVTATDLESALADISVWWMVTDTLGDVVLTSDQWSASEDGLSVGEFVVTVTVTDEHGGSTTINIPVEIVPLDSDGDWIPTCNSEWFDTEKGVNCGPDIYDEDDDNDGHLDTRDAWPLDPCASSDSDADGMPDNLHCPVNVETDLIADSDDDNDGILDVDEGLKSDGGGLSMSAYMGALLLLAVAALIINRMRIEK